MKYVVDTHALLWYLSGSPRLSAAARRVLEDPASELVLPAIALAEACWTVERGRISLSVAEILAAVDRDVRLDVLPLDRDVVARSLGLTPINEMHDRQIVATALVLQDAGDAVSLLTHDGNITASGLVSILW